MPYLMFDLAYWNERVIGTAQQYGAKVIGGYAYDPFLQDVNGYSGGWTPDVVRRIGQAGITFLPIFTMRPATGQILTPARCVEVLMAYPLNSDLVAIDVEDGSDPGQAAVQQWCQGLKAANYRPVVYGSLTTIHSGYASDASHTWGASYYTAVSASAGQISYQTGGQWLNASALDPAQIAADAWQYGGSVMVDGVDIDLSTSIIPIGGDTMSAQAEQQIQELRDMLIGGSRPDGAPFVEIHDKLNQLWQQQAAGPGGSQADIVAGLAKAVALVDQHVLALSSTGGRLVDLTPITSAIAAVKAELDQVAAQVKKDLA